MPKKIAKLLFSGLFLLYFSTAPGGLGSGDAEGRYDTAKSWVQGRRGVISESHLWSRAARAPDGRVFTLYNPLQSVLMTPIVAAAQGLPLSEASRDNAAKFMISLLLLPLISAGGITLLFLALCNLGFDPRSALYSVLTLALATIFWPYAVIAQEENLLVLEFALWLYGIAEFLRGQNRGIWITALAGSLLVATKLAVAPILLSLAVVSLRVLLSKRTFPIREWASAAACVGATLGGLALYNYFRFGSPFESGYSIQMKHFNLPITMLEGWGGQLAALLLSPYRGIFYYSPPILLGLAGAWSLRRREELPLLRWIALLPLIGFAGQLLFISSTPMWHSGFGWGPRYLVSGLFSLAPLLAVFFRNRRLNPGLVGFLGFSVLIQLFGVSQPGNSEDYLWQTLYKDQGSVCIWKLECSPQLLRLQRSSAAFVHSLTGESGIRLDPEKLGSLEQTLETSDFKTLYFWPFRLVFRFGFYSRWVAWLLMAGLFSGSFLILKNAVRRTELSSSP